VCRNLGILPGGDHSRAGDLNDWDEVVGTSASAAGDRAVLWTRAGNVRDLGTLPGDKSSEGVAINNDGDVVGNSKGPTSIRAFLWTKGNGMEELGVLAGGNSSQALDINDSGAIVGSSTSSSGDHAFIWTRQAGMRDLNSAASAALGVVLIEAHAINSKGEIIATGRSTHEADMNSAMTSGATPYCAPAPPSIYLLTPETAR
jgi:probable HAF family extracellular repeat protein